jgi:hypothetical protein
LVKEQTIQKQKQAMEDIVKEESLKKARAAANYTFKERRIQKQSRCERDRLSEAKADRTYHTITKTLSNYAISILLIYST